MLTCSTCQCGLNTRSISKRIDKCFNIYAKNTSQESYIPCTPCIKKTEMSYQISANTTLRDIRDDLFNTLLGVAKLVPTSMILQGAI